MADPLFYHADRRYDAGLPGRIRVLKMEFVIPRGMTYSLRHPSLGCRSGALPFIREETMRCVMFLVALTAFSSQTAIAQLADNAPADNPIVVADKQLADFNAAIAPLVEQARASYPSAKERFLQGLPRGETFYVNTPLRDARGRTESVFVRVTAIQGTKITGVIANTITLVSGYREGQDYSFNESELTDWLISRPDGSEEGNLVGKFLDSYQP